MLITSVHNEHIKELERLKEKKYRDQTGLFLVETSHLAIEAYRAGLLKELLVEQNEIFPIDVPITYVSKEILKKLSSTKTPPKVIAVVKKKEEREEVGEKVLILDRIQDPGNLGTIIRSAVAFNIDTIICSPDTVDFYNPKVVRASQGMMFHLPILVLDTEKTIQELKKKDYKIIGTKVTNGEDVRNAAIYSHFALVIGNEGQGISEIIEKLCDQFLYIKMNGNCESLNASVAASILLYEISNK
ncbi:MAG: RNA methyltransferase [Bacilli bacterium]|nr:RNA methyltransferase [Bacilli bacterium]